jgi:hypothetical protein
MIEDRPEDTGPAPDSGRAKRAPPTIDLEASEISGETRKASGEPQPEPTSEPAARKPATAPVSSPISSWVIAMVSGAVAASLAIAVAWVLGWPPVPTNPPVAPQLDTAVIDGLAARIASVESKTSKPPAPAPDPAAAARIETLEKSIASLRSELAAARAQSEKIAAEAKATTGEPASSALDLSAINERIGQIERATRAQGAEIAQENAKPADDVPLRRIVAAALLDVLVRTGDPYPAALTAAKSLTDNADALKPLDGFATSGVPSVANLSRELLTLVPKLSPPAPQDATTGTGIVDRLQAGAAKLVRIERTDVVGNDRGAIVSRVTAAALRNETAEARRELKTLAPADRTAAQAWLDKSEARDAALAASRQFAADAMAALAKPRQ